MRQQVASALNMIVHVSRLSDGTRKVLKISEITGMEGEVMSMHDLFGFKQTGVDENRTAKGYFYVSGIRPHLLERLAAAGVGLPVEMFERHIDEI
jgi:pilus assembly protein CpaF